MILLLFAYDASELNVGAVVYILMETKKKNSRIVFTNNKIGRTRRGVSFASVHDDESLLTFHFPRLQRANINTLLTFRVSTMAFR